MTEEKGGDAPKNEALESDGPWQAGSERSDCLVWRDDPLWGPRFVAGTPAHAKGAAAMLNALEERAATAPAVPESPAAPSMDRHEAQFWRDKCTEQARLVIDAMAELRVLRVEAERVTVAADLRSLLAELRSTVAPRKAKAKKAKRGRR